jgi:hypothetical protein
MGYRIVDTVEGAALEVIYLFCSQHRLDSRLVCSITQIPKSQNGISG